MKTRFGRRRVPDTNDSQRRVSVGDESSLLIVWSPIYRSEWDDTPEAYLAHGVVRWGRSRRLAKAEDARRAFKGYLGVQHYDPRRWHGAGEPRATFFLSLFIANRTLALHTYATLAEARAELGRFHARVAHG